MPEAQARKVTADLASKAGFDQVALCRDLIMDWNEIRALAKDPLVTIGAHTCRHFALAKLPAEEARSEISNSTSRIE
jgi:hypothetical protein